MALVLVVDDDPLVVRSIQALLQEHAALETAGTTSLDEARTRAGEADVLVIGLRVTGAGADDGLAFIKELVRDDDTVETLLTTATADADGTARALAAVGPLRHIARPVDPDALLPRVHAAIERRTLRRTVRALHGQLATHTAELAATHGSLATATERLVQAEQLAAVGRVVSGIAHALTEQLALVGYAEALKSRVAGDAELVELADVIVAAQKRLAAMVDEIRDFASAGDERRSLARQPSDLAAVVDEALAIVGFDRDVRRRKLVRQWRAHPIVELDHDKFSQVVVNLVSNAALATEVGDEVTVSIALDGDRAQVIVEDRGAGMPPEVLARLGEPFFTTRGERGSGLGVGICMRIVEAHGGTLTYCSEVGQGTTAVISLPVIPATPGGRA